MFISYDPEVHEFPFPGINVNPVSDPDLPASAYKESAHLYSTNAHSQLKGDPIWNLKYGHLMYATVREAWEGPMYKLMIVLGGTTEGKEHRKRATTQGNRGWAWIYPSPHDLHVLYANILIGLPPQPKSFRCGRHFVDNTRYEGLKQVVVRDRDKGGCLC